MARTDRGYAKAYLREPIAAIELSHLVRDLPIVKWTREIQKTDHKVHYSAEYFILAVMCDKVGRDGSECPWVETFEMRILWPSLSEMPTLAKLQPSWKQPNSHQAGSVMSP